MNEKQFRLFCAVFCRKYKGKTFEEVFPNCMESKSGYVINESYEIVIYRNDFYYYTTPHRLAIMCFESAKDCISYSSRDSDVHWWSRIDDSFLIYEDII